MYSINLVEDGTCRFCQAEEVDEKDVLVKGFENPRSSGYIRKPFSKMISIIKKVKLKTKETTIDLKRYR